MTQTNTTEKTGFDLLATFFANPHALWVYHAEHKHRRNWVQVADMLRACCTHTEEEIRRHIQQTASCPPTRNIRGLARAPDYLQPAALAIAHGFAVLGPCALCQRYGVVGLREPLTDRPKVGEACARLAEQCHWVEREAEWWRQLLTHMAEWLMREATEAAP